MQESATHQLARFSASNLYRLNTALLLLGPVEFAYREVSSDLQVHLGSHYPAKLFNFATLSTGLKTSIHIMDYETSERLKY